jgi:hypothetical protein
VRRRLIGAVALVVVLAGIGIGAYLLGRANGIRPVGQGGSSPQSHAVASTSSTATSPTSPISPTTTTTVEGPTLPLVLDCGEGPLFKPTAMHWCQSMCSSSMQGISWRNWGTSTATGVGTLVTRTTTVPATTPTAIGHYSTGLGYTDCEKAKDVYHAGTPIVLSNPALEKVCSGGQSKSVWLFTKVTPPTVATVNPPKASASECSGG